MSCAGVPKGPSQWTHRTPAWKCVGILWLRLRWYRHCLWRGQAWTEYMPRAPSSGVNCNSWESHANPPVQGQCQLPRVMSQSLLMAYGWRNLSHKAEWPSQLHSWVRRGLIDCTPGWRTRWRPSAQSLVWTAAQPRGNYRHSRSCKAVDLWTRFPKIPTALAQA